MVRDSPSQTHLSVAWPVAPFYFLDVSTTDASTILSLKRTVTIFDAIGIAIITSPKSCTVVLTTAHLFCIVDITTAHNLHAPRSHIHLKIIACDFILFHFVLFLSLFLPLTTPKIFNTNFYPCFSEKEGLFFKKQKQKTTRVSASRSTVGLLAVWDPTGTKCSSVLCKRPSTSALNLVCLFYCKVLVIVLGAPFTPARPHPRYALIACLSSHKSDDARLVHVKSARHANLLWSTKQQCSLQPIPTTTPA